VPSPLGQLHAKVDAFFARVEARHGDEVACRTGCADCCRARLTVTGVEARAIAGEVARWSIEQRRALAAQVEARHGDPRCAALDDADRCTIYEARPIVCRSHGVPVRLQRGSLPVIEVCPRNFARSAPAADCVLDQATLSTLVLAVDRAEGGDGSRTDLAQLLAALAAS
jgi:Fe-S-cluster containining protein